MKKRKSMQELINDLDKNERISFPVTYELKVIMDNTLPDESNKSNIQSVLEDLEIKHRFSGSRPSSVGTYTSFTYTVTIVDYQQLHSLYDNLRPLPGIKLAI